MPSFVAYEEDEAVEVCVRISSPAVDCPIVFPFDLIITAIDRTAGKHNIF